MYTILCGFELNVVFQVKAEENLRRSVSNPGPSHSPPIPSTNGQHCPGNWQVYFFYFLNPIHHEISVRIWQFWELALRLDVITVGIQTIVMAASLDEKPSTTVLIARLIYVFFHAFKSFMKNSSLTKPKLVDHITKLRARPIRCCLKWVRSKNNIWRNQLMKLLAFLVPN